MNSENSATAPDDPRGRRSGVGGERLNAPSEARGTTSNPDPGAGDKPAENAEPSAQGAEGAEPGEAGPRAGCLSHAAGMMSDVKRLVKDNPVPALIGAAILGFLLARTLTRD